MKRLLIASLLIVGCKYGGSEVDPLGGLEPGEEVVLDALDASSGMPAPSTPSTPSMPATSDARAPVSSGSVDAGAPRPATPSGCEPAKPAAVCDPVRNTGCPPIPLMQCDADITAAEPTGRCSIYTPTPIVPCSSTTTASSTACFPKETCVQDQCRVLCYCNADCPDGQTCSDVAGAFKLCR